jgi:hypothetical protein
MKQPKMVVRKEIRTMIMIKLLILQKKKAMLVTLNTLKLKNNISDNENSILMTSAMMKYLKVAI